MRTSLVAVLFVMASGLALVSQSVASEPSPALRQLPSWPVVVKFVCPEPTSDRPRSAQDLICKVELMANEKAVSLQYLDLFFAGWAVPARTNITVNLTSESGDQLSLSTFTREQKHCGFTFFKPLQLQPGVPQTVCVVIDSTKFVWEQGTSSHLPLEMALLQLATGDPKTGAVTPIPWVPSVFPVKTSYVMKTKE